MSTQTLTGPVSLQDQWRDSHTKLDFELVEFNEKLRDSSADLDAIDKKIQLEMERIKQLRQELDKRELELSKGCCQSFSSISYLKWLYVGVTATGVVSLVGTTYSEDDNLRIIGLAFGIGSTALGGLTYYLSSIIGINANEKYELTKLSKMGVKHAKLFRRFLKEFKEAKQIELERLRLKEKGLKQSEDYKESLSEEAAKAESIEKLAALTPDINKCARTYCRLPSKYFTDETYSMVVSTLVRALPPSDPLKKKLDEVEALQPVEQPAAFNYTASSSADPDMPVFWEDGETAGSGDIQVKKERHASKWSEYQKEVLAKFKLKKPVSFIETSQGHRLNERGVLPKRVKLTDIPLGPSLPSLAPTFGKQDSKGVEMEPVASSI